MKHLVYFAIHQLYLSSRGQICNGEDMKGYGHSVIFLAYFLTKLSSLKMNRERLTVKQFCRTGIGLYRAIVLARWAMDCLYTLWACGPPCLLPPRPGPPWPGPPPYLDGTSFSNRAILSTPKPSLYEAAEKKANIQRDHTTLHPICFKTSYVCNCIVLSRCHIRDGWSESTSPLKEDRWLYIYRRVEVWKNAWKRGKTCGFGWMADALAAHLQIHGACPSLGA